MTRFGGGREGSGRVRTTRIEAIEHELRSQLDYEFGAGRSCPEKTTTTSTKLTTTKTTKSN